MRHETRCHVEAIEKKVDPEALRAAQQVHLAVAGMGCPNCALRVRNALLSLSGVVQAEVSAQTSLAEVWFDASGLTLDDLIDGVASASAGTHHDYLAVPLRRGFRDA